MSSHPHVYVGPYVACKVVATPHTTTVIACTSPACPKDKPRALAPKAQFCDACGSPIGPVEITVDRRPSPWDGIGDAERLFHMDSEDGFYYYGVNEGGVADRDYGVKEGTHVDLHHLHPPTEIAWFIERYAAEIRDLEAIHADVTVSWGIHHYYM